MTEPEEILQVAAAVLVVDYPTRDVPEALARAGLDVVVRGGPGPNDYSVYEVEDGDVVARQTGRAPERADVVYAHRPLAELAGITATAQALGARALWLQSGLNARGERDPAGCWMPAEDVAAARDAAERAGLALVWETSIVDAAQRRRPRPGRP